MGNFSSPVACGRKSFPQVIPQAHLLPQGYSKGKPREAAALVVMSGLVRGRYFTHFIALLVPGLLDGVTS
jgi:hypothetical protein